MDSDEDQSAASVSDATLAELHAVDVSAPVSLELFREGEDEIERPVVDAAILQRRRGGCDTRRVVRPVHPRECAIVERLDAERYAVHSGAAPRRDGVRRDVVRVRLNGDFRAGRGRVAASHHVE